MTEIGHNSDERKRLQSFVDRLHERETEKQAVAQDIRDIKTEIKTADLDPVAVAAIVKEKMLDAEKSAKAEKLAETIEKYKSALKILSNIA